MFFLFIHTRNSKDIKLNKLENTSSLLTIISNIVSGISPRSSIAEIIKDTARTSNSTSPISRADLLSTAYECANTLLFPDQASNLLPDEHSFQFDNLVYCEGATDEFGRPSPRPEKQINHSLNESISKHHGSRVLSHPFRSPISPT